MCVQQDKCANGSAVRAIVCAVSGEKPEPGPARLGELLPFGTGESGLPSDRCARDEGAAPVAVSDAQGEVREMRALPRRGLWAHYELIRLSVLKCSFA